MQIIQCIRFKYKQTSAVKKLLRDFRNIVNFCTRKCLQLRSTDITKLHKTVYRKLKKKYDYNTQYFLSAYRIATSMVRDWKKRGRRPKMRRLLIKFSPLLTKFENGRIRVSTKPREFLYVDLRPKDHQRRFIKALKKGKYKLGEIILTEKEAILPFKEEIKLTRKA